MQRLRAAIEEVTLALWSLHRLQLDRLDHAVLNILQWEDKALRRDFFTITVQGWWVRRAFNVAGDYAFKPW